MDSRELELLVREMCRHPAMLKLDALMREQAGVGLIILMPKENKVLEVFSAGGDIHLPRFCRLVHSADGGPERCITCRSLMTFAAFNRGLIEHTCHGGVSVLAAPAVFSGGSSPELLVLSSCAFTPTVPKLGWKHAREHAKGLAIPPVELRKAYFALPHLKGKTLKLARSIVDIAATTLARLIEPQEARATQTGAAEKQPASRMEQKMGEALRVQPDSDFHGLSRHSGGALVDVVSGVVRRNPALPFSVADIARAAHLSPNHFSWLFRKHMGQSFSTFLAWMRISLAQELMRDLKLSIREAAERAGFDDPNYFARRFKQKTGVTPRQWRAAL
jgi:AraC-like DNA-binding protein